jgi:hypothetical protein
MAELLEESDMPDGIPFDETDGLWRFGTWQDTEIRTGAPRNHAERVERYVGIRALTATIPSVLYAVRLPGGTIKIGCTSNFASRLSSYGPDSEVLGFRAGDRADEQAIHKSLKAHLRHGREWYHPTSEVFAVVNDMRDDFGLPHLAA